MIKVGFVTDSAPQSDIYRGMDAYARYLFPHLQNDKIHPDIKVEAVSSVNISKSPGYDLYHFPVFSLYHPQVPLSFSKPFLVTVHDVTRLEFPQIYPPGIKGQLKLAYQKIILDRTGAIITDSYSSVKGIIKYLSVPSSKIVMIYLAAPDIFRPLKNGADLKNISRKYRLPEKFVLFNGDIDWNKNLTGLLMACKKINVPLVLYGKSAKDLVDNPGKFDMNHPELAHLSQLLDLLKRPDVRLLGYVPDEDLVKIFNLAAVYCQPSFAEGFGLPVLQAMACAVPVACSKTHSLPEIAGEAAIYFDPGKPDEIASVLKEIMTSPQVRSGLVDKGLVQAAKFSWDKTALETIQTYRRVSLKHHEV